jgi:hypothetical protein
MSGFDSIDDAVWVAEEIERHAHEVGGRIRALKTEVFVSLSMDVRPYSIKILAYFDFPYAVIGTMPDAVLGDMPACGRDDAAA